ncbi:MAG: hypothetical protein EOP48_32225, partial [Sphingobacteriales bacterium]
MKILKKAILEMLKKYMEEIITSYLYKSESEVFDISISPDSKYLALACSDQTIQIVDIDSGENISTFEGHYDEIYSLCYSLDGKQLYSAGADNLIKIWDIESEQEINNLIHQDEIYSLATSPNGDYFASAGADKIINIYDAYTYENIFSL